MSQGYDNSNSGMLAKNDRKETADHPDYRGMGEVDGNPVWISAWIKVGREGTKLAGQKYFSLAFSPREAQGQGQGRRPAARPQRQESQQYPQQQPRRQQPQQNGGGGFDDMEDDIPF